MDKNGWMLPKQTGSRNALVCRQDGWTFPRSVADIPKSVSDLLVPASRRYTCVQQKAPPTIAPRATAAKKPVKTKVGTVRARIAPLHDTDGASDPTRVAAETNAIEDKQDQALAFATEPANRQPADQDISFPTFGQQFAPASVTPVVAEPRRPTSAASLDNLHGIEPITEAPIKTLAGKARTGRLDETKALELLRQSVLL
jgi:hypothetical protein